MPAPSHAFPPHSHSRDDHDHTVCGNTCHSASPSGSAEPACGCETNPVFDGMSADYRRALGIVVAINAAMFVIEMVAGQRAGSTGLQADALDFLADTLTYGLSLWVIGAAALTRARLALLKGLSLAGIGLLVLGLALWRSLYGGIPDAPVMGLVGFLALAANLSSVVLLWRHRQGDANVMSVWLCSRNDAIGNVAVMAAALGVFGTASRWPDLAVALVMASLSLSAASRVIRLSLDEIRDGRQA